jgi:hypothetical protein
MQNIDFETFKQFQQWQDFLQFQKLASASKVPDDKFTGPLKINMMTTSSSRSRRGGKTRNERRRISRLKNSLKPENAESPLRDMETGGSGNKQK